MDEVPTCDILLLEISTLQMETSDAVRQLISTCKARGAVVLYRIASKKSLSLLDSQGVKCLREPASLEEISRACVESAEGGIPGDPNVAPRDLSRLFSYEQLHQIAAMSPAIKCECPNHLADLISSLNAFQKYSEECMEDGDTKDREIHADLRDSSAQARVILEHALERLLKFENIVLS